MNSIEHREKMEYMEYIQRIYVCKRRSKVKIRPPCNGNVLIVRCTERDNLN